MLCSAIASHVFGILILQLTSTNHIASSYYQDIHLQLSTELFMESLCMESSHSLILAHFITYVPALIATSRLNQLTLSFNDYIVN